MEKFKLVLQTSCEGLKGYTDEARITVFRSKALNEIKGYLISEDFKHNESLDMWHREDEDLNYIALIYKSK